MRRPVDIMVHVPLEAEYLQFREIFPVSEELRDDLNVIAIVDAPSNFKMAVIVQEKMGRGSAQNACQKALSLFDPKLYVCLGIGGCLTKDLSLGDVCYTGHMHDVYDNSKVTDDIEGGLDIAFSPEHYSTERGLTAAMGFVRTLKSLSELYASWREEQGAFVKSLNLPPVPARDDQVETIAKPKCLNGDIVCGVVSESDKYRERLKGVTRNMLAVETESGPIFELCQTPLEQ